MMNAAELQHLDAHQLREMVQSLWHGALCVLQRVLSEAHGN